MGLKGLPARLKRIVGKRTGKKKCSDNDKDDGRKPHAGNGEINDTVESKIPSLLERGNTAESGEAGSAEESSAPPEVEAIATLTFEEDGNASGVAIDSNSDETVMNADNASAYLVDESDSEDDGDNRQRGAGGFRGLLSSDPEDGEDLGSSNDDLADLPAGYLDFLSGGQSDIDEELSAITNQLCGNKNGGRGTSLFEINFVRESLFDEGAIRIARAMEEGCGLNQVVGTDVPRHLPYQGPSKFLKEIVLSRCQIGDEGACAIANAISISCTISLKSLDLSSNNITGVGATCIANCVVTSNSESSGGNDCNIETLVLSVNPIGSTGASALANALRGRRNDCPSLRGVSEITSGNNMMGFCSLKNLHVSGCGLNDEDAISIGSALLSPNSLSEAGMPSSLPPPRTNCLMLLNIHGNRITSKGMKFLYSIIDNHLPARPTATNVQVRSVGDGIKMIRKSGGGNGSDSIHSMRSLYKRTNQTSVWEIVT